MTTKREWVLKAFKNETVDKVPVPTCQVKCNKFIDN